MENKRILHTIETRGPGGAEILLLNIAINLESDNFENYGFFIKKGWLEEQFKLNSFKTFFHKPIKSKFDLFLITHFFLILLLNRIKIIHSHEFALSFFSTFLSLFLPLRVVSTFHGFNYHCDNRFRQKITRFISKHAKLVTVSDEIKTYLIKKAHVKPDRITVIRNGILLKQDAHAIPILRNEYGLKDSDIIIGSVGRLNKVKGYKYLIFAAAEIAKKHSNTYFFIAGDGPQREELEALISEKELQNIFFLLGNRSDIASIYKSLDIYVVSSLSEGTSLALLEAMSNGLPIIATNVGGNKNVIKTKNNGILIPPRDPRKLMEAIEKVLKDEHYRTDVGLFNSKYVRENYDSTVMMQQYHKLYGK